MDRDQRRSGNSGNAFYDRLNQILDAHKFDAKVEQLCRKYYKSQSAEHVAGGLLRIPTKSNSIPEGSRTPFRDQSRTAFRADPEQA